MPEKLSQEILARLEIERDLMRQKIGRITFDCFNTKVKEGRVHCSKGHLLGTSKDGNMAEITVLRGVTPSVCRTCNDYEGDN